MFCVSCGAENPEGARFCHKCGAAMVGSQPAPAAPSPPVARPPAATPVAAVPPTAPQPPEPAPAPAPARVPARRSKQTLNLIGGLLIAAVLVGLALVVLLNGLAAVVRIIQNVMVNGPGVVIGIIMILVVIGIVGTIVSFLLKPLRK